MLLKHFAIAFKELLTQYIFVDFLLIVALAQSALRKELFIGPFVERFKPAILGKS